jgi:peptidoglycan/xylan/chitin deacetylase (PgdA/CDA1 family)
MNARVRHAVRRTLQALLLPLSIIPILAVVPAMHSAYKNFDRRHKSGPLESPAVVLTAAQRARYPVLAAHPGAVPVITYHGINDKADHYSVSQRSFARQLALLRRLGYRSLSIAQYVRFLRGDTQGMPARPVLITFDDGRLDSYRGADRVLQRYGFRATMFAIPGQMRSDNPFYLTWKELQAMQASGRWDIQEHAGAGHYLVNYDQVGHMGPFYAFRRWTRSAGLESLADWEQRVTTDVFAGRDALKDHIHGFRPLTFAVPYGNYGQNQTNDRRIPGLMQAFLQRQFEAIFVQDNANDPAFTTPAAHRSEAARYEVHTDTTMDDIYAWLRRHVPKQGAKT